MRNKFEGKCYVCGHIVRAGTGHFERYQGRWRVKHAIYPGFGRVTCAEVADKMQKHRERKQEVGA